MALQSSRRHAFETNSLDHCETPLCAYENVQPVLEMMAKHLHVQPSMLRIWDPYYCDGTVKQHLASLGYDRVINENFDFYKRVEDNTIPEHDVLLTNPPYSGDHIERLLKFVTTVNDKPFCLLMPNWVARKKEYKSIIGKTNLFYVSPIEVYTYAMPTWNSKPEHVDEETGKTTPYLSSWYVSLRSNSEATSRIENKLDSIAKRQQPPVWVVAKTVKGLKWKIQKVKEKKR
ncbi:predicted protein [Thalassiosira pseudonana CCMP1335]|jgi:hypothetical protein|uniref:Uncharacterized protein n=1 Tax=Thalassiosira pseudonana TaxID=35128 RepID=B8C4K0_THAPS|nr:predicted protein [Thalassiosira pseudonana CCMP1335]EED91738.1 predicted protein [Thalassiosira pseudonana CCMP1335]